MAKLLKPNPLTKDSIIHLVAPASIFKKTKFHRGENILKKLGFKPKYRSDIFSNHLGFAGSDKRRATELNAAFKGKEYEPSAILCVRGGYGTMRIAKDLNLSQLKKDPPIFAGYSDVTYLQMLFFSKIKLITFHTPMLATNNFNQSKLNQQSFFNLMTNFQYTSETLETYFKEISSKMKTYKKGKAKGVFLGGNLTMISKMFTKDFNDHLPDLPKDIILFLEDISEPHYSIDRNLQMLFQSSLFSRIKGIVFGEFLDQKAKLISLNHKSMISETLKNLKIPIVTDFPAGHGKINYSFPLGIRVELSANPKTPSLKPLESPFNFY